MDASELLHRGRAAIRAECCLPPHPLSTFSGDGPLGQFVLELDLELAAVEAPFSFRLRDMKLSAFLPDLVCDLVRNESRRGEDEFQRLDLSNSLLQRLEGVD